MYINLGLWARSTAWSPTLWWEYHPHHPSGFCHMGRKGSPEAYCRALSALMRRALADLAQGAPGCVQEPWRGWQCYFRCASSASCDFFRYFQTLSTAHTSDQLYISGGSARRNVTNQMLVEDSYDSDASYGSTSLESFNSSPSMHPI
jgi:hypothetical protein